MAERKKPLPVAQVDAAALRAGLRAGDSIVWLNNALPLDVLDLEMAAADGVLRLGVLRDGQPLDIVVELSEDEWHGISLGYGGLGTPPRTCRNACAFCFVDQVPDGLRPALAVKDDDYRLSFLHGNFTTLSNLSEADVARIVELRLSPLYVSLHAWDDEARVRLMGAAAAGTRATLERLAAAGIQLHLQVVLCPGWNDGSVLAETVFRAAELPAVADIGIVPVSLAEEGELRRVTPADAEELLAGVTRRQEQYQQERGVAFVHAADEFWLLAGKVPPASDAGEQYENGIGICADFLAEAATIDAGGGAAAGGPDAAGGGDAAGGKAADGEAVGRKGKRRRWLRRRKGSASDARGPDAAGSAGSAGRADEAAREPDRPFDQESAAAAAIATGPVTGVRLLSGTLAAPVVARAAELLQERTKLPVSPFVVANRLFGPQVTVTGLLGGAEVLEALRNAPLAHGEWLLAPRLFLPAALGRTLDDVTEEELVDAANGRLAVVGSLSEGFGRLLG